MKNLVEKWRKDAAQYIAQAEELRAATNGKENGDWMRGHADGLREAALSLEKMIANRSKP